MNLKVAVGAPEHSNLVPHQQKCCCVISKGRAFHRPTSHPPAAMGSGLTRKAVEFKSSSNKKLLGPLVQKQSTPQPNQPHGRAQLDMVVLLMWRVVMTHTAGRRGMGGANLVSDSISININVRTLHGRKASNASQASNASSRMNLHIRCVQVCA